MVPLMSHEAVRMSKLGLPVITRDNVKGLPHPCPALDGTACSIYQHRPMRCFWYRCNLLTELYEDTVSFEYAMGVVQLAKELEGAQRRQFVDYHLAGRSVIRREEGVTHGVSQRATRRSIKERGRPARPRSKKPT